MFGLASAKFLNRSSMVRGMKLEYRKKKKAKKAVNARWNKKVKNMWDMQFVGVGSVAADVKRCMENLQVCFFRTSKPKDRFECFCVIA